MRSRVRLCLRDVKVAWLCLLFLFARSKILRKSGCLTNLLCFISHRFPTASQTLPAPHLFFFFFVRTILPLLCMPNLQCDLQACHLKLVWDHPSENAKQRYLSLSPTLLHPTPAAFTPLHAAWPSSLGAGLAAGAQEFPLLPAAPSTLHNADRGIFHLHAFRFPL